MRSERQMTETKRGFSGKHGQIGVTSWLGLLLVASLTAHGAESKTTSNCEEIDASLLKSPDVLWAAKIYGEICDLGLSTSASVVVDLVREGAPARSQAILAIDMPSRKSDWPKLKWDSSTRLVIELTSGTDIGLQMANYQGIEVEVRFCPRDPASRARWLEYKKSYRKWIADSTAWVELKKREPKSTVPRPVQPKPPEATAPDTSCLP